MLPTIDEFRADHDQCSQRTLRTLVASIGSLLVFLLLGIAARNVSSAYVGPVATEFLPVACVLVGIPLMLFGFWRADQHQKKFPNLRCRHCAKPLMQSARIVIASRNCPHCGRQVLTPPSDAT